MNLTIQRPHGESLPSSERSFVLTDGIRRVPATVEDVERVLRGGRWVVVVPVDMDVTQLRLEIAYTMVIDVVGTL